MKILFVAMDESIHTARWISQICEIGWDLHLFSSTDCSTIHEDLKNITIYRSFYSNRKLGPGTRIIGIYLPIPILGKFLRKIKIIIKPDFRERELENLIVTLKPDIIHSMEFQAGGYLVMNVKKKMNEHFPSWIATNWGSDIYYYMKDPDHLKKIKEVLSNCNYYSCECRRDITLARQLGLKGKTLPVLPNAGGFDLEAVNRLKSPGKTSSRKLIMLKGYHGWVGRGLIGLSALELCLDILKDYEIVIFSASPVVVKEAKKMAKNTEISIRIIPPSPYEDILKLFGQAKIYIGLSISDAISTSLLESMVMGAFPIQSETACADEWITDGKSGFIVPPENVVKIADAIRKALLDDDLVDQASEMNYFTVKDRLDSERVSLKARGIYEKIIQEQ